jgi:hypothetical protein
VLKPRLRVYHDLLDAESVNPHHEGKPFVAIAKHASAGMTRAAEVDEALQFVADRTGLNDESVIVPSNHDDMLGRWINRADWKNDPVNADFYLEIAGAMARQAKAGANAERLSPFAYLARQHFGTIPASRCSGPTRVTRSQASSWDAR